MSELRIVGRPALRRPVLVAAFRGWNDGGQGATGNTGSDGGQGATGTTGADGGQGGLEMIGTLMQMFSRFGGIKPNFDVQPRGCTLTGTDGDDSLTGTPGDDVIQVHVAHLADVDRAIEVLAPMGTGEPRVDRPTRSVAVPVDKGSARLLEAVRPDARLLAVGTSSGMETRLVPAAGLERLEFSGSVGLQ